MPFAVEVKGLVKVYNHTVRALDGVDLNVEAGKAFALLGPNGAGKTTLMRILTTQLKPTAGEAYVFGLNAAREGSKVRRLISYVPQEMSVWTDISGYENLLVYAKIFNVPRSERQATINDVLESMGLSTVKDELAGKYSGGMVRRLEIACAMLIKPKVMFLDEPTIGLDPAARKTVWEKLGVFKKEYGVTIFFNTHYMDEADLYADDIAIINQGKIITRGTSEELKHSLGGEIITFTLESNAQTPTLRDTLKSMRFVRDIFLDNSNLSMSVDDAESALPYVMNTLKNEGISARKVSITKPTLDDVFLKYVGTRLEEKGRISEVTHMRYMIRKG
jgi:ABC-2 type transport system ATP-binding protein